MTRGFTVIGFTVLVSGLALCQQGRPASPAFDIADVHVSPRSDWVKNVSHRMDGGFLGGDRYQLRRATMLDLIRTAYKVDPDKVFGGPTWLDYDRFEVVAKTRPGTRPETLRLMLQSLLADRFHLVVKPDTQSVPGLVLSAGKGDMKLRPAVDPSGVAVCQSQRPTRDGDVSYSNYQCRNMTMQAFVPVLHGMVSLPIADSTGLDGAWDFDLQYAMTNLASGASPGAGVSDGLAKLGLKLEPGKVPQPVLTVISVDETPTANSPETSEALPPLPSPEFEVASIRPCNDNMTLAPRFEPGGRVTATCMPALGLITRAWKLAPFQTPVGVPKSFESGRTSNVTIVAKAPANSSPDEETLTAMLRALLIDRYKMTIHYEDRPVDADTLVAVKPKLTKADPANRTGCTRQNVQGQSGARLTRLTCQNITMAQFAEQIQAYQVEIFYPVLDGTAIEGAWDFTFDYDPLASLAARGLRFGPQAATPEGQAADPTGAISFTDAIARQLGLKLEVHKRPEPVLIIDQMDEKPTEN